ncbi:hypothetical protein MtrunA17_Chr8g0391811 [Medicago truncatula]|uniref:Transmembrane protein n=1 Tax=Medicago truncatula TaxID=3880 RepID=A0A396GWD5_MEDTR|nr:hypothetical protein MtrunA17_Chr8g0391811 [Medicago truncatula]
MAFPISHLFTLTLTPAVGFPPGSDPSAPITVMATKLFPLLFLLLFIAYFFHLVLFCSLKMKMFCSLKMKILNFFILISSMTGHTNLEI